MTSTSALQALRPSQGVHSAAPTRYSSRASRLDVPGPGHPARFRSLISTAGLLARGSPPASAFPGVAQWHSVEARRLQLRGQLRICTAFPLGSSRCREETVESGNYALAPSNVNAGKFDLPHGKLRL
jgi:hypothetical protein